MIGRRHGDLDVHLLQQVSNKTIVELTSLVMYDDVARSEAVHEPQQKRVYALGRLIRDGLCLRPARQVLRRHDNILVPFAGLCQRSDEVDPPSMKYRPDGNGMQRCWRWFVERICLLTSRTTTNERSGFSGDISPPKPIGDFAYRCGLPVMTAANGISVKTGDNTIDHAPLHRQRRDGTYLRLPYA